MCCRQSLPNRGVNTTGHAEAFHGSFKDSTDHRCVRLSTITQLISNLQAAAAQHRTQMVRQVFGMMRMAAHVLVLHQRRFPVFRLPCNIMPMPEWGASDGCSLIVIGPVIANPHITSLPRTPYICIVCPCVDGVVLIRMFVCCRDETKPQSLVSNSRGGVHC
jgi:hypothetical protein